MAAMANLNDKDTVAGSIAQKRADFIKYLYAYFIVNVILWVLWWFTEGHSTGLSTNSWPIWIMLGWGIGMAFKYFEAYHGLKNNAAEQEYKNQEEA